MHSSNCEQPAAHLRKTAHTPHKAHNAATRGARQTRRHSMTCGCRLPPRVRDASRPPLPRWTATLFPSTHLRGSPSSVSAATSSERTFTLTRMCAVQPRDVRLPAAP